MENRGHLMCQLVIWISVKQSRYWDGWKPEIDIETGIRNTMEWVKSCINSK